MKKMTAIFLVFCLLAPNAAALSWENDFIEHNSHWASDSLQKAVENGILNGDENGNLDPDGTLPRSQMAAILCRALGARAEADVSAYSDLSESDWFYSDAAKALALGIIRAAGTKLNMARAATREEAFYAFAAAFQFISGDTDLASLDPFSDSAQLAEENRYAAAALVEAGIVEGSYGNLNPTGNISRAEFVTMLYRIIGTYSSDAAPAEVAAGGALVLSAEEVALSGLRARSDVIMDAGTQRISLQSFKSKYRVLIRSEELRQLSISGETDLATLVLANLNGDFTLTTSSKPLIGRLVIGHGTGEVLIDENVNVSTVDIISDNRRIEIFSESLEAVGICGSGNTVIVHGGAGGVRISGSDNHIEFTGAEYGAVSLSGPRNTLGFSRLSSVESVHIRRGALNTALTIDGGSGSLLLEAAGSRILGGGIIERITVKTRDYTLDIDYDSFEECIDPGLEGASVRLSVELSPGGSVHISGSISALYSGKSCGYEWLLDGESVDSGSFTLENGSSLNYDFMPVYGQGMTLERNVTLRILYANPDTGESEMLEESVSFTLTNYSDEYYLERSEERILNLVTYTYAGDYTLAYAENNDYKDYEKEIWAEAKGYTSSTSYLIWINRTYQRVNIFEDVDGSWKLIHSFIVGTGSIGSQTPVGVTYVTYRSEPGWRTASYSCKPVVGFYPGTGYAFHSRLYNPNGVGWYDSRIGFPVSHGCIRMYDEDINWIYDNIPLGTAVVIH